MADRSAVVLLTRWESTLGDLLDRTRDFPKAVRFTFASRIDNLALDILDQLVRARWAPRQHTDSHLARADAHLAVLRVLLRLSFERQYLSRGAFEHVARNLDEAGRMLGGWRQSLAGPSPS